MEKCSAPPCSRPNEGRYGRSLNVLPSPWQAKLSSSSEGRDSPALRNHSEAEKRRRERINAHRSTLRLIIPNSNKMDKASLLGKAVDHLKDLKRKALDIDRRIKIPAETNKITVDLFDESAAASDGKLRLKASVCCDDRPALLEDLMEAFDRLRLTAIRADMMSLGGRVLNVFLLRLNDCDDVGSVCLSSLERSVRDMLDRVVSCSAVLASENVFLQQETEGDHAMTRFARLNQDHLQCWKV